MNKLFDYGKNSLAVEIQGVSIGAPRWGIIATYCYIRRFHASAIFSRVEKWGAKFILYWTESRNETDEHATFVSKLWSKKTAQQPDPLDKASDSWIESLEREHTEQQARNAKHSQPTKNKRRGKKRGQDDELLLATKMDKLSFEREPKPEPEQKSDYDKVLENLF